MQKLDYSEAPAFQNKLRDFCEKTISSGDVSSLVTEVLADIRGRGDEAVLEYTRKFDGARMKASQMRVTSAELEASVSSLSPGDRKAIREAIEKLDVPVRALLTREEIFEAYKKSS